MKSSQKSITELELEFVNFYKAATSSIYNLEDRKFNCEVTSALKTIRQLKYITENRHEKLYIVNIQFESPAYRCAYLFAYSVLHTTVVYHHFFRYIKQDSSIISRFFPSNELKICCLGGGPGVEAVAICKLLNDFFISKNVIKSVLDIYLTVIDLYKWDAEIVAIVDAVNNSTLLDSNKIKLHAKCLQANLLKPFEKNLHDEINDANIVTMVKLASAVSERTPRETKGAIKRLVNNVIACMKENSCLLMLDNAGGDIFNVFNKILSDSPGFVKIISISHKLHTLNDITLSKMESLKSYEKNPSVFDVVPTTVTQVSSCVWEKNVHKLKMDDSSASSSVSTKPVTELKVDESLPSDPDACPCNGCLRRFLAKQSSKSVPKDKYKENPETDNIKTNTTKIKKVKSFQTRNNDVGKNKVLKVSKTKKHSSQQQ